MQKSKEKNEPVEQFRSICGISYDQLQKFWDGLPRHGRQELLKLDKQTFLEQVRKKDFCARCYGFLVEEFSRIVMYWKCSRQDGAVADHLSCNRPGIPESKIVGGLPQDPSIDPWGCLATTRDGTQTLTLLACYFESTSIEGIQKVFDSACTRERERTLLYPVACGVGGRTWKGSASREACAVHTLRVPLENLVDFWSSQGQESRQSLFKMKQVDFVQHLTFRIEDNKFCRNCRKNVFQELTSIRKESGLHFQCEISHDTVKADWSQTFMDTHGSYLHFEWGIGSAKGKSDISDFKSVGLSKIVQVSGLDLSGLDECYITLRAWKTDGDCTELSVKAHTSMGQRYGHCRLVVGDGFVSVTEGESILNFFKHAEEVVKEDKNLMDKNGNRLDGECSHSLRDARSPESARKFLLDAATVFFREQNDCLLECPLLSLNENGASNAEIEKAFREKRAHQSAHSVFVSLAVNMIEERAHVACKERHTLDNQIKLLEDEAKEKNEEEERKERRRTKEREKKLRRKERTKEKGKNGDNSSSTEQHLAPQVNIEDSTIVDEEPDATETVKVTSSRPVLSPHFQDEKEINEYMKSNMHNSSDVHPDENFASSNSKNGSSGFDQSKCSEWKLKNRHHQDTTSKSSINKQFAVVPRSGTMVNKSEKSYRDDHFDSSSRTANRQNKHSRKQIANRGKEPMQKQPNAAGEESLKFDISQAARKGFSFFHFDGPSSLANAYEPDCLPSEKEKNGDNSSLTEQHLAPQVNIEDSAIVDEEPDATETVKVTSSRPVLSPHFQDEKEINEYMKSNMHNSSDVRPDENFASSNSKNGSSGFDQSKCSEWKLKNQHHQDTTSKSSINKQFAVVPRSGTMVNKSEKSYRDDHFDSSSRTANRQNKHSRKQIANRGNEPMQKQPNAEGEESLKSDISQAASKGFSFFHFDGPSSLANAYEPDSLPSEDFVGGHSLVKSIVEGSLPSNKRDSFKEYNLFSTNMGITFSIFSK